jgi:DNA-binding NarL/FixJ family response regulator
VLGGCGCRVAASAPQIQVSPRLTLSEATVKTHVPRILTKLGLRDRVHAVVLAYETGLTRAQRQAVT